MCHMSHVLRRMSHSCVYIEEVPMKWIDGPSATEMDKIPSATEMDDIL